MFPPQTSFIPVTVALARFAQDNSWWGNYPFWNLGSAPFKYLTGPILPAILVTLHKLLPGFSLFDLSYFVIFVSLLIFSAGWGIFSARLSNRRQVGVLVGAISLILPWHLFSSFAFGEVSAILAQALTPWVLIGFRVQGLGHSEEKNLRAVRYKLIPALSFAFLLLVNPVASIPAILGLVILGYFGDKKWEVGLKRTAVVVLSGWFLTLWWFTPGYWLTLFAAPSIGGRSAVGAFWSLIGFLRILVPVAVAFAVVFWAFEKRDKFIKFAISWLTVFGIFTIFRFLADPKFWMDWTSWLGEVEVGIVLLITSFTRHFEKTFGQTLLKVRNDAVGLTYASARHQVDQKSETRVGLASSYFSKRLTALFLILYLFLGWLLVWQNRHFWLPTKFVENRVEYKVGKILELETRNWKLETGNDPVTFLSGSSAFWLNAFFDIKQVRGGADQGSTNKVWRQVVWEVREGSSGEKSYQVLANLGVDYLVVHTPDSSEFYHDFKNTEKFEENPSFAKIYGRDWNIIYGIR